MNVPPKIGMVLSHDPSLIVALNTTIGQEGLADLIEVISIDAHNRRVLRRARERGS